MVAGENQKPWLGMADRSGVWPRGLNFRHAPSASQRCCFELSICRCSQHGHREELDAVFHEGKPRKKVYQKNRIRGRHPVQYIENV